MSITSAAKAKLAKGSVKEAFKNEDGAIDLASIMVGIIVIGLIGGVIAATVFAVIPWSQDNAAKQQLNSIVQAENAYMGLSSAVPSPLAAGYTPNSYTDSPGLANASLLVTGPAYCAVTINSGKGFQGFSASASGAIWTVTDANTSPSTFTGTLPSACSGITAASPTTAPAASSPAALSTTATWSQQATAAPGSLVSTSGNFATQLAAAGSSTPASISTNSGTSWTSTPYYNFDVGAVSQNGTNVVMGRSLSTNGNAVIEYSTNSGASWTQFSSLGPKYLAKAWVSNDGQTVILAGGGGGDNVWIQKSTNGGATFQNLLYISSSYKWTGLAVSSDGSHIYATDSASNLHLSADGGATWQTSTVTVSGVSTDSTGKYILAAGSANNGKVFVSSNYGSSFTQIQVGTTTGYNRLVAQLAVSSNGQSMTVTGYEGSTVVPFISRDAGQTWTAQSGISGTSLQSEISTDGSSFLAWNGTTVYKGQ